MEAVRGTAIVQAALLVMVALALFVPPVAGDSRFTATAHATSFTVTWNPIGADACSRPAEYVLAYRVASRVEDPYVEFARSTRFVTGTVEGLTPETTYDVTVTTIDACDSWPPGWPPPEHISVTTPAKPAASPWWAEWVRSLGIATGAAIVGGVAALLRRR